MQNSCLQINQDQKKLFFSQMSSFSLLSLNSGSNLPSSSLYTFKQVHKFFDITSLEQKSALLTVSKEYHMVELMLSDFKAES